MYAYCATHHKCRKHLATKGNVPTCLSIPLGRAPFNGFHFAASSVVVVAAVRAGNMVLAVEGTVATATTVPEVLDHNSASRARLCGLGGWCVVGSVGGHGVKEDVDRWYAACIGAEAAIVGSCGVEYIVVTPDRGERFDHSG